MHERKRPPEYAEGTCLRGLGGRLRSARRLAGLTQSEVAGERFTKSYISAIEHELVRPSLAALDYLANQLGTTCARLLSPEDSSNH